MNRIDVTNYLRSKSIEDYHLRFISMIKPYVYCRPYLEYFFVINLKPCLNLLFNVGLYICGAVNTLGFTRCITPLIIGEVNVVRCDNHILMQIPNFFNFGHSGMY